MANSPFSKGKVVLIAGLEPANGAFSVLPVWGVSMLFITHEYTDNSLYLQGLF
jgi:hypothetical protein